MHEARSVFPDIPIELIVSVGTGRFEEIKVPPRVGWDGIVAQILDSATDAEQVHHAMEVRSYVNTHYHVLLSFYSNVIMFYALHSYRTYLGKDQTPRVDHRCPRQNISVSIP